MEEMGSSPPPTAGGVAASTSTGASTRRQERVSVVSRMRVHLLSFVASLQEGFTYVKAFFVGQAKKIRARNEQEAAEADLQTSKMQVEAADAAEKYKTQLTNSM